MDALGTLPLPYREILLLCEVEELSYRETAEVLDVPIGTVMSRLSRARTDAAPCSTAQPIKRIP